jgi:cyclic lactone autoinducer peptide
MKVKMTLRKLITWGMNSVALALVVQTANSACMWIFHQPEFPDEAKKYKRIMQ